MALCASHARAATIVVPTDQPTIQAALDLAAPGDVVQVKNGVYYEQIEFPTSGAPGAFISVEASPGHHPVLDGSNFNGARDPMMVTIDSKSYVRIVGFEIRNLHRVRDGSGIRVTGAGTSIEIRDNIIRNIRGKDAMGITVYGTESASISNLIIDGNKIYDCDPAKSEALTLNGNIESFEVTNNVVRDVNNIGIDLIGGEKDIQPDTSLVVRNGVVRGNRVERTNSIYGGGFAGGIYVDGGKDITIERNVVTESDLGIEIGAENSGIVTSGIVVRDNLFYRNDKACIVFGGFSQAAGRVKNSSFFNNTCYGNDTVGSGFGELWIQYAEDNFVRNNIFHAGPKSILLVSENPAAGNSLDYNVWYAPSGAGGARFSWQGDEYTSFDDYRAATGFDANSIFADADFFAPDAGDFHLEPASLAIDAGDPVISPGGGETDLDGAPRLKGLRMEAGAYERGCGDGIEDPGESCDDSNTVDCDGCDRNCSPTSSCGNRIVCAPEECDDGNTIDSDCCTATCQARVTGTACQDGDLCTRLDQCDGAGACQGNATPEPVCRGTGEEGVAAFKVTDSHLGNKRDTLYWRMTKGDITELSDYGDPRAYTPYALCVYDASAAPQPKLRFDLPPGGVCVDRVEWRLYSTGYRYANRCVTSDGIYAASFLRRSDGRANLRVQGRRERLRLPPLGFTTPVTVQLRNNLGGCWGVAFDTPIKNTAETFRAVKKPTPP